MDVKLIGGEIRVLYKLKKNETYKFQKSRKAYSLVIYKKPQMMDGVASATEDNKDILLIDYDNTEKEVILRDYRLIQERFHLPQSYLFKTNNGYHVACLIKCKPKEIFNILSYTHCDSAYTDMPLRNRYKNWILRISPKNKKRPQFIGLIGEDIPYFGEISNAHKKFLDKVYPKIKHPKYSKIDNFTKICIQRYETG